VETRKRGFTVVEILTVITIIAILVGVLLPAITKVKTMTRETQQKSQLNTISLAISAFRNDFGDYPPSRAKNAANMDYSGTQKLTEALVGWDLMGFHPDSEWESDGLNENNDPGSVYHGATTGTQQQREDNLKQRKGPYLENATETVFRLGQVSSSKQGIFKNYGNLAPDTYVICDVFTKRRLALDSGRMARAGTPILYFRANTNFKDHRTTTKLDQRIYTVYDNSLLMALRPITEDGTQSTKTHPLADNAQYYKNFYDYITDDKVPNPWPYRPDSYLLISAGADGEYGTVDDITNFK
jgi:prepilin-type N-terminal cleavage/methylation domain-containing protein